MTILDIGVMLWFALIRGASRTGVLLKVFVGSIGVKFATHAFTPALYTYPCHCLPWFLIALMNAGANTLGSLLSTVV